MMRSLVAISLATVAACGGSSKQTRNPDERAEPDDPAVRAREAERERIAAMEPPDPYETKTIRGYRAKTACGQGPYHLEATTLGTRYGEQLEVKICAPRHIEGDYRIHDDGRAGNASHFGSSGNNEHCKASERELAQRGSSTSGGAPASTGSAKSTATSAPTKAAAPIAIETLAGVSEACPDGTFASRIVHTTTEHAGVTDLPPWPAGRKLVVEVWSTEPMHLDGATFVVIQRGVRADMTAEAWGAYREAYDRWRLAYRKFVDGEVEAGRSRYLDMTAHSKEAPPLPRAEVKPPKPSPNAEWIAGFWQREGEWIWSAGFWRVPQADIVAEATVEAPVAPPPVKVEAPPKPAVVSQKLVWTPGYWAWNGAAYIWIEGAWRLPPPGGAQWVAPTWTPRRGRVVFDPGGWSIVGRLPGGVRLGR